MRQQKLSLEALLRLMTDQQRLVCEHVLADFTQLDGVPGSSYNHQTWRGGYRNHVEEVMNLAYILYPLLNGLRRLKFSLDEALFVSFIHDMDKLFRYEIVDGKMVTKAQYSPESFKNTGRFLKKHYGYALSADEMNALQYVHGEGKDYSSKRRAMNELAAFVHCCDIISARIWFDKGKNKRHW